MYYFLFWSRPKKQENQTVQVYKCEHLTLNVFHFLNTENRMTRMLRWSLINIRLLILFSAFKSKGLHLLVQYLWQLNFAIAMMNLSILYCTVLYCMCQATLFLSSSVSFHRLTVLGAVFHGTQEKVCSSLHVHRHIINQYLTSSWFLSSDWLFFWCLFLQTMKWIGDMRVVRRLQSMKERQNVTVITSHTSLFLWWVVGLPRKLRSIKINKLLLIAGNILHWEPDFMNKRYFFHSWEFA